MAPDEQLTIFGLGNAMAGDDGVGERVIDRLRATGLPPGVRAEHVAAPGPELVEWLERPGGVWFIDAARAPDAKAGAILRARFGPDDEAPLDVAGHLVSTHGFSLAELLRLARVLGRRRASVRIWGVVGERFDAGAGLSDAVAAACDSIAKEIADEMNARARPAGLPETSATGETT